MAEEEELEKKKRKAWKMEPVWCAQRTSKYCRIEGGQNAEERGPWTHYSDWKRHNTKWHTADAGQSAKFYPTEAEETYLFLARCQRCEEGFNERQQFLRHCGMQPGQLFGEEPKVLAAMDCYSAATQHMMSSC